MSKKRFLNRTDLVKRLRSIVGSLEGDPNEQDIVITEAADLIERDEEFEQRIRWHIISCQCSSEGKCFVLDGTSKNGQCQDCDTAIVNVEKMRQQVMVIRNQAYPDLYPLPEQEKTEHE